MICFPGEKSCFLPENVPFFSLLPRTEEFKNSKKLGIKKPTKILNFKNFDAKPREKRNEENFKKEQEDIETEILGEEENRMIIIDKTEKKSFLRFFNLRLGQKNSVHSFLQNEFGFDQEITCLEPILGKNFSGEFFPNILAVGGQDGSISLLSLEKTFFENSTMTRKKKMVFQENVTSSEIRKEDLSNPFEGSPITCLSWNPRRPKFLLSGSKGGTVKCWDFNEGKRLVEKISSGREISCLDWSRDNKNEFLYLNGNDTIFFFDIRCGKVNSVKTPPKLLHSVFWGGYDNLFITGENKGKITIYDRRKIEKNLVDTNLFSFRGIRDEIKTFLPSPKKKNFLLVGKKGSIEIWNHLSPNSTQRVSSHICSTDWQHQFGWIEKNQKEKVLALKGKRCFSLIN